jgi:prophage tail gpP-like protein
MAEIRLIVDGEVFTGWITVEVERRLDTFASRFSLGYLDRWEPTATPWKIRAGAECTLSFGEETLLSGHVNRARFRANGEHWELAAEGRSYTGDLVDCSAIHETGHWSNKTATAIITDLVQPYGLSVLTDAPDTEVFARFGLEDGETVQAAIDRLTKVRALLPITLPTGDIKLIRVGEGTPIALDLGSAVSYGYEEDDSQRFSEYRTRAISVGRAADAFSKSTVKDLGVKRFRPLVIVGDAPTNTGGTLTRGRWEANVRAGRAERLHYTVLGALNANGRTYQPGQLYDVRDDVLGVSETFVCAAAIMHVAEHEFVTELELCRPETYQELSYPPRLLTAVTKRGKPILHATKRGGR